MTQYYFLGAYLPSLQLGLVPDISIPSFLELLKENLSEVDKKQLMVMQRYYELENLRFSAYFEEEIQEAEGFLKAFLTEERAMRLILTALRAKKFKRSILTELQYEDSYDDLVAYILAQKDAKSFDPPEEYTELKVLFENLWDKPLELHQAIAAYRFQKANEWIGLQVFSIDRLLAYYFQLILVDQWIRLDQEKGQKIMNTIVQDT